MYKDYKTKRVVVDDRIFKIEFWNERCSFGLLPWYRVSEVKTKMRRKCLFSKKFVPKETYIEIDYGWTCENRVDMAMNEIKRYIQSGENRVIEQRAVDEFCREETEAV